MANENNKIERLDFEGLKYYDGRLKEWVKKNGGVTWGKLSTKPDTPTIIRLNQTISDPYQMLSGEFGKDGTPDSNVISWIRANSHRYVGNYDAENGMVLRQLDDNNSELYADGSDASEDIKGTNGGDVFMKMPDFWFKGVDVDGNPDIVDMYFSVEEPTEDGWTKWDGNTLIGAYEADYLWTNEEMGLRSWSGVTPIVNVSQANFKEKARIRNWGDDHFMLVTYEAHQVMALLYMAYYGNTSGQATIGSGTYSYPKVAGQTNMDGMNDTIEENSRSINFWGLENWWGDIYELMDNLESYNNSGGINILDYSGNTKRQVTGYDAMTEAYITKMLLGEVLDMISKSSKSSGTTGYCDAGYVYNIEANGRVAFRSYGNSSDKGGPFTLCVGTSRGNYYTYLGTRLLYHGRVTIQKNAPQKSSMPKARSLAPQWRPIDLQYVYRNGTPTLRTGFDFNNCNVHSLQEVGKLSLYGLNINYDEIEFESNALASDNEGNLTFNTDTLPQSVDMNYKSQLIGTLKFYDISEDELIKRQREEIEKEINNPND